MTASQEGIVFRQLARKGSIEGNATFKSEAIDYETSYGRFGFDAHHVQVAYSRTPPQMRKQAKKPVSAKSDPVFRY